jgi:photosystem II stability/assembly factor-like uncharacterized protein
MAHSIRRSTRGRTVTGVAVVAVGMGLALPAAVATASTQTQPVGQSHLRVSPGAGVPGNFKAQSMSWLTAKQAWVLGSGKCSPKPCSDVVRTSDGGGTWNLVGSVPVPIQGPRRERPVGVTEIRMSSAETGWAFGPKLLSTDDGGVSWTDVPLPSHAQQVLSLGTTAAGAYLVTSPCLFGQGFCGKPLTAWFTSDSGGTYSKVPVQLSEGVAANVATYGGTVYISEGTLQSGGSEDAMYVSRNGNPFSSRPSPCDHAQDLELVQVVPTSATQVNLLCVGDPGMSKAVKTVYRSSDTGRTVTYAGQAGLYGLQSQLAASASGNLAMSSVSDGSFIYVNNTGGTTWTMPVAIGDGGIGWNDIVYTTDKVAWVIYAPAATFFPQGVLYVTRDAGATWERSPF